MLTIYGSSVIGFRYYLVESGESGQITAWIIKVTAFFFKVDNVNSLAADVRQVEKLDQEKGHIMKTNVHSLTPVPLQRNCKPKKQAKKNVDSIHYIISKTYTPLSNFLCKASLRRRKKAVTSQVSTQVALNHLHIIFQLAPDFQAYEM